MMVQVKVKLVAACVVTSVAVTGVGAPVADVKPAGKPVIILDGSGFWRYHYTLKAPFIREDGELKQLDVFVDTAYPPKDWISADFDDSAWRRLPGPPFPAVKPYGVAAKKDAGFLSTDSSTPCLALICMRGKFAVTDPAKANSLKLNVEYRGGVVVYINGKEVARGSLPDGKINFNTHADDYPEEAFHVKLRGNMPAFSGKEKDPEILKKWDLRKRRLENVEIPRGVLRKGVNVLAIEIHRSPYWWKLPEICAKLRGSYDVKDALWCTCDLMKVRLTVPSADGIKPNVVRPKGVQVWNSNPLSSDFDLDWGDPNEKLKPVRIVGTLNGAFSGKVVVGSDSTIKGLSATMSDFTGKGGAKIPASAVQIRYPSPDNIERNACASYPATVNRFDALFEKAPAEVSMRVKKKGRWGGLWVTPDQPPYVPGAVQSVWVTVRIPADAKHGEYRAELTVKMDGAGPFKVPVSLKVCPFKLPEPHKYHAWAGFVQSPDTLSIHYNVPLWSDEHWKLIEKSLKLLGGVGDKTVYIPLIAETNQGNAESMVRWIKDGNKYKYDFTIVDKYLDLVQRYQKEPEVVCLYLWDIFLLGAKANNKYCGKDAIAERKAYEGKGPEVTVLDPASGKTEKMFLPRYEDPEAKALWKPLLDELREKLKKRGWEKSVMLGIFADFRPSKEEMDFFSDIVPGVPWVNQPHSGKKTHCGAKIGYQSCGGTAPQYATTPQVKLRYGWKKQDYVFTRFRRGSWDGAPIILFSQLCEINVMGAQRGFGRMGADQWLILKNKRGRLTYRAGQRYFKAEWRNLNILTSVLAPGPDGPVTTGRLEMMRQGIEECEARIVVERAVTDEALRAKLGEELAKRCEKILAERTLALQIANNHLQSLGFRKRAGENRYPNSSQVTYQWYLASGWQKRAGELFEAAAEVAEKLGTK